MATKENKQLIKIYSECGSYMRVKITGGWTIIHPEDEKYLKKYDWFVDRDGYAVSFFRLRGRKERFMCIRLHQLVAGRVEGKVTDHKNRVRLDNRRSNLHLVTSAENRMNRGKQRKSKIKTPFLQQELLSN